MKTVIFSIWKLCPWKSKAFGITCSLAMQYTPYCILTNCSRRYSLSLTNNVCKKTPLSEICDETQGLFKVILIKDSHFTMQKHLKATNTEFGRVEICENTRNYTWFSKGDSLVQVNGFFCFRILHFISLPNNGCTTGTVNAKYYLIILREYVAYVFEKEIRCLRYVLSKYSYITQPVTAFHNLLCRKSFVVVAV